MVSGVSLSYNSVSVLLFVAASWPQLCAAVPLAEEEAPPPKLALDNSPAPLPESGPELSRNAIRDTAYLPAQIGGIVGAYGVCLVIVAIFLITFSKSRRERIRNRDLPEEERNLLAGFDPFPPGLQTEDEFRKNVEAYHAGLTINTGGHIRNFSVPTASPYSAGGPLSPTKSQRSIIAGSPVSTVLAIGVDLSVDQTVVARDRSMAQAQLEEMYRHVMEQEQAKAEGREYIPPPLASPSVKSTHTAPLTPGGKREKNKPSNLNLSKDEKSQSRTSSIFSFLKSPRKSKTNSGVSHISSPIMTPMSGTFPQHTEEREMNRIHPRYYAPPAAPPLGSEHHLRRAASHHNLPTPEVSPVSTGSIDRRIDATIGRPPTRENRAAARRQTREDKESSHSRDVSAATSSTAESPVEAEPVSAVSSEKSTSGLVGLPLSPKPGVNRFPSFDSLPASPRPGDQSFPRQPAPSAVRTGGALPLRAYEQPLASPSALGFQQTVFTRAAPGPLSPGMQTGMRTPWTGAPVPYTPYQPFSPVIPITPSVVTRADRKRMKKLEPKTPTVEMVKDEDEVW